MSVISQPNVTVSKLSARLTQGLDPQKMLVIGQKLSSGGAIAGQITKNVKEADLNDLFGRGSIVSEQLLRVFDTFRRSGSIRLPQVDVVALDDNASAVGATATIVIDESASGGTDEASRAGSVNVIIGSEFNYSIKFDIRQGATISGLGALLATEINKNLDLPFTATESSNTVTLTAKNGGTVPNLTNLKITGLLRSGNEYVLGNVAFSIATNFTNGAGDPTLPDLSTLVGDDRYQTITHPVQYGTAFSVTNFLDSRFNVEDDIQDGVVITKKNDTLANLTTVGDGLNSQSLVYIGDKSVNEDLHKGSAVVEFDYVVSARVSALRALRLTENARLVNIVLPSAGFNDLVGGIHMASYPYFNTPVMGVTPAEASKGFTKTEIEELANSGVSVVGVNKTGTQTLIGEVFTTYKTDAGGNVDRTWRFLNTVDTMSVSAEYIFNNMKADFAQSRLTDGDIVAGYSMANAELLVASMKSYYLSLAELALVPSGEGAVEFFLEGLSVVLNIVDGRATINSEFSVVTQLRELIVNLRTNFGI